jgi:RNA polymerase sigma-70 factor (ECF subfamily)
MDTDRSYPLTIADLYLDYQARLFRYAMHLAHDAHQASDLVQETLIKALNHLDLLQQLNVYQRQAWLYQVLKNLFLDQRRARLRMDKLVSQLGEQDLVAGSTANPGSPDAAITNVLHLIPRQYREVLERRHILGMTSHEIGAELGLPAATVRSRLRLAVQWMRANRSLFT